MSNQTKYTNLQLDCGLEEIAPSLRLEVYNKVLNTLVSQKKLKETNLHGLCMMLPMALYNIKEWQDIYEVLPIEFDNESKVHINKWKRCYVGFPEAKGLVKRLDDMYNTCRQKKISKEEGSVLWFTLREQLIEVMIIELKLKHPEL